MKILNMRIIGFYKLKLNYIWKQYLLIVHYIIHSLRYLNFNSNQSSYVKRGVIKYLYDRAEIISSNYEIFIN